MVLRHFITRRCFHTLTKHKSTKEKEKITQQRYVSVRELKRIFLIYTDEC